MSTNPCTTMKITGLVLLGFVPHLASDPAQELKTGWITKQGSLVKNWKQRWFVLSKNKTLKYYDADTMFPDFGKKGKQKGTIDLQNATKVVQTPNYVDGRVTWYCFDIHVKNRVWHLRVAAKDELATSESGEAWMSAIANAATVTPEFVRAPDTTQPEGMTTPLTPTPHAKPEQHVLCSSSVRCRHYGAMSPSELRKEIAINLGRESALATNMLKLPSDRKKLETFVRMCRADKKWTWGWNVRCSKPDGWKGPGLRDGWEAAIDDYEGRAYYWETSKKGTTETWDRPPDVVPGARRLAADPSTVSGSPTFWVLSMIPLMFLVYWFFSRKTPVKRSRKQSTYRCHYPENAEDFSDVEPEIDMV